MPPSSYLARFLLVALSRLGVDHILVATVILFKS